MDRELLEVLTQSCFWTIEITCMQHVIFYCPKPNYGKILIRTYKGK